MGPLFQLFGAVSWWPWQRNDIIQHEWLYRPPVNHLTGPCLSAAVTGVCFLSDPSRHTQVCQQRANISSQLNNFVFLLLIHKLAAVICQHLQGDDAFIALLLGNCSHGFWWGIGAHLNRQFLISGKQIQSIRCFIKSEIFPVINPFFPVCCRLQYLLFL